ncbi:MAG: hypothetical protein WKF35_02505 [Ferruginibacter sp.]
MKQPPIQSSFIKLSIHCIGLLKQYFSNIFITVDALHDWQKKHKIY